MKKTSDSIKRGLTEGIADQKGSINRVNIHAPAEVDVRALRKRIGFSQQEFAAKFSISLGTLRHWERADRKPRGPALVLLKVIDREGGAVLRALH